MKQLKATSSTSIEATRPAATSASAVHAVTDDSPRQVAQRRQIAQLESGERTANVAAPRNALPEGLKTGVEALSGVSMDGVKVHYNSSKPANVGALAYAQGEEIHVAAGQEEHLPHEAWHVVQQKQGRVKPTRHEGTTAINDTPGLEQEATQMGAKALEQAAPAVQRKQIRQDKTMQKVCKHCGFEGGHAPNCTRESRAAATAARVQANTAAHDQSMDNRTRADQRHPLHGPKKSGAPRARK